ncbi:hypothetical protein CRG98_044867 [Punica granatum]|uniref:Uncharacterized protein n=1 Tax=Punica granatum TaxID=22663 RepID=A0A2I0HSR7_PUNGR|nr:hypothetical protein CRG98_044867 [Punica granatum]
MRQRLDTAIPGGQGLFEVAANGSRRLQPEMTQECKRRPVRASVGCWQKKETGRKSRRHTCDQRREARVPEEKRGGEDGVF